MFPILFKYKFITIGGYGVMLGTGFYLAFLLLERELRLRNINPEIAYKVLFISIPAGIVGSKLFHILEHMDEFVLNPMESIFSGAGLSAYGGFVFAMIGCFVVLYRELHKDMRLVTAVYDAVSPSLALGYCFGRFGCHVAGDGCYGIETKTFWGTTYPNGIVPTIDPVFPTPLFEVVFSFIAVGLLLNLRKRDWPVGRLFSLFLILSGLPRFLVEFIRRNPKFFLEFTQGQLVGLVFIALGIAGWIIAGKKHLRAAHS